MQMSPQMGYDRAITVFSPDGRLFQVEYAREAVKRGTTAVGIKSEEGVALLVDKRITSDLIESKSIEKIFQIDDHIGAVTSGLVADARVLIDKARIEAMVNRIYYDEPISVETLSKRICDQKQNYTQYGGVRPYGTALLIAGVNSDGVAMLFETDPSGALLEYKATGIGAGRNTIMELFEENFKSEMSMEEAILLGLEGLYKTTEGKFNTHTIEIGLISRKTKNFEILSEDKTSKYIGIIREQVPKEDQSEQ